MQGSALALTSSLNPSSFGQSVTFTVTVVPQFSGTATGTVTFRSGTATLGSATLSSGVASYTTTKLAVGTDSITAVYNGSSSFLPSTSIALSQMVNQASTTTNLTSSPNPSSVGQAVIFTASVSPQFSGTPTGSVVFKDGTKTLKTVALSGGVASYTTSTLTSGTHNITATYNGSTSFIGSSDSLTQTMN
jgi:Bacterial Ig-like domain (group 3)